MTEHRAMPADQSTPAVSDDMRETVREIIEAHHEEKPYLGCHLRSWHAAEAAIDAVRADERRKHTAFLTEVAEAFGRIGSDGDAGYWAGRYAREWADRVNQHLERGT